MNLDVSKGHSFPPTRAKGLQDRLLGRKEASYVLGPGFG